MCFTAGGRRRVQLIFMMKIALATTTCGKFSSVSMERRKFIQGDFQSLPFHRAEIKLFTPSPLIGSERQIFSYQKVVGLNDFSALRWFFYQPLNFFLLFFELSGTSYARGESPECASSSIVNVTTV